MPKTLPPLRFLASSHGYRPEHLGARMRILLRNRPDLCANGKVPVFIVPSSGAPIALPTGKA